MPHYLRPLRLRPHTTAALPMTSPIADNLSSTAPANQILKNLVALILKIASPLVAWHDQNDLL